MKLELVDRRGKTVVLEVDNFSLVNSEWLYILVNDNDKYLRLTDILTITVVNT